MRYILTVMFMTILSCQWQQEVMGQTPNSAKTKKAISSFLDSVEKKQELSSKLISTYIEIDSASYTGYFSNASFTGDTVFHFFGGFIGAIIKYNDGKFCITKWMYLFSPEKNENTTSMEIYSDCDRDEDSEYSFLRYKFLNESSFETIESFIPANSHKVKSVERHVWKISSNGRFYSVN